jgi:hypothetical protein
MLTRNVPIGSSLRNQPDGYRRTDWFVTVRRPNGDH